MPGSLVPSPRSSNAQTEDSSNTADARLRCALKENNLKHAEEAPVQGATINGQDAALNTPMHVTAARQQHVPGM